MPFKALGKLCVINFGGFSSFDFSIMASCASIYGGSVCPTLSVVFCQLCHLLVSFKETLHDRL